jgi:hypothetical protein
MLEYTAAQRLRQRIARVPGVARLWDWLRLTIAPEFREDGLATIHNCDFVADPRFVRAYRRALERQPGTAIRWRAHVVQWAGAHAATLRGDFVECGVNRAFLSTALMAYIDFDRLGAERRFYLFDTFSGLVPEQVRPEEHAAFRNPYTDCFEQVRDAFRESPNVILVRGVVPDSLRTVAIEQVAYLSIDMNCVAPEVAALEFFWPRLVPGAVVILDDYGFSGHESQKRGADEFAARVGAPILTMPTGQGLMLKS